MEPIKVLIVDDSAFMRTMIKDLLSSDKRIQVIGTARNGADAINKLKRYEPDVITMDVEMPVMNGLDCLEKIMNEQPLPIIMLSSTTVEGAENTIAAIQKGAFDFVPKPSSTISFDLRQVKDELIKKIIEAQRANIKPLRLRNQTFKGKQNTATDQVFSYTQKRNNKLVLIGSSTGGPRALEFVIKNLPKNFAAPILIVQHMPKGFTKSLAERLNFASAIEVKEAEHGEILRNGVAYIAPGGKHLKVRQVGHSIVSSLTTDDPVKGHRPSVDTLFFSAAKLKNHQKIAIVLTGMGSDGAYGLEVLKHNTDNTYTIAESENTAVIYGMPKSAIQTGYVDKIANLDEIACHITRFVNER